MEDVMAVIRNDPFRDLIRWSDAFARSFDRDLGEPRGAGGFERPSWTPPCDIFEDSEGILLKIELPEVDAKEVDISLEGNTLTLRGERRLEREDRKEGYTRMERWSGSFLRSFTLPSSVNAEQISAESREGVLRIFLPKKAETKPRQIKVQAASGLIAKDRQ
jgi:HSP20 family protein